ncbi:hypothetical protein [Frondihabitans sucicola]|uniref:hypothetical protein n=1 Tax=Frondihabitans sucicola TaxID=1268041 RepID=UPI0025725B3C|nr:hypothetical protein [Frondihabitans sucicola]
MRSHAVPIAAYVGRKLVAAILTLFFLATIVFLLTKLTPGDEARAAAGSRRHPIRSRRFAAASACPGLSRSSTSRTWGASSTAISARRAQARGR